MNTATGPLSYYHRGYHSEKVDEDKRLSSSLRQHSQHKHSPAYGYQARNCSVVDLWPDKDINPSREARLADEVSRNRMLRQGGGKGETARSRPRRWRNTNYNVDEIAKEDQQPFWECRRRKRRFARQTSSQVVSLDSGATDRHSNIFRVIRGLRHRDVGDENHRWSLEPRLREERHPVFIQPVKEYVMKRWKTFRLRSRHDTSTLGTGEGSGQRPAHRRLDSNI